MTSTFTPVTLLYLPSSPVSRWKRTLRCYGILWSSGRNDPPIRRQRLLRWVLIRILLYMLFPLIFQNLLLWSFCTIVLNELQLSLILMQTCILYDVGVSASGRGQRWNRWGCECEGVPRLDGRECRNYDDDKERLWLVDHSEPHLWWVDSPSLSFQGC